MKARSFLRGTTLWSATMVIVPWTFLSASTASAGTVSYTYDSFGRLTKASYANGPEITYEYDAAGNRTKVTTTTATTLMASPLSSSSLSVAPTAMTSKATGKASSVATAQQIPSAPVQLSTSGEDPAVYGWNDLSRYPEDMVTAVFEGDGNDRLLHLQGYDIDTSDEIGLWLNGTLLGFLSAANDGGFSPSSLWLLPAALQFPGENTVELVPQTQTQTWGVTRFAIYPLDSALATSEGETDNEMYRAEGFELHLFNHDSTLPTGYLINLTGGDANNDEGITFELNEAPLADPPESDNPASGPGTQVKITPGLLMPGDNRLWVVNHSDDQQSLGVRIDRIDPDSDTTVDTPPDIGDK